MNARLSSGRGSVLRCGWAGGGTTVDRRGRLSHPFLETYGSAYGDDEDEGLVRRGFRGEKYAATFKFKWDTNTRPGWLVRWIDPGNWLAVAVNYSDNKAALYKCVDGHRTCEAPSFTTLSLSTGTWYEAKVVVDDDGSGGEQLAFWEN